MVSLAYAGGNGARQGIRAGDLVVATSASVGDAMWAKDTLAGVQTAISTRIGQSVRLRLQRRGDRDARPWEVPLNHTYEVELRQPLGLVLRQRGGVDDASQTAGWVEVAEVDPEGTAAESGMVRLGDAVVATSGTLGNSMWEKSSAEGVTAAIGTRFALSDTVRRDWRRDGAEMPRDAPGNRRPHTHPGHTPTPATHTLVTFPCIASKCCEKALAAKNLRIGDRTPATPNAQVRLRLRRTEAIGPWATELWEAGRGERDALSPEALRAYRAQACTVFVVVVVVGHALRAYRAQACTVAVVLISARSRRDLSRWRPPRAVPRRQVRDAPHGRGDARGAVCCLCAATSPARRAARGGGT